MIEAILFDMDGLMFDTETAYSVVQTEMFKKRGKIFTNEIKRPLMGKRANEVIQRITEFWGTNERVEDVLQEQDRTLMEVFKSEVKKLDGLDDLISFLDKNNIRRCIGTSSRRFLVDILLEKYKYNDTFEFVVSGDMVTKGKPDPEIYNNVLQNLDLMPPSVLCWRIHYTEYRRELLRGVTRVQFHLNILSVKIFRVQHLLLKH